MPLFLLLIVVESLLILAHLLLLLILVLKRRFLTDLEDLSYVEAVVSGKTVVVESIVVETIGLVVVESISFGLFRQFGGFLGGDERERGLNSKI